MATGATCRVLEEGIEASRGEKKALGIRHWALGMRVSPAGLTRRGDRSNVPFRRRHPGIEGEKKDEA